MTASLTDTRSADLYRRALALIPGGVNSPVRAMRAIGRDPLFIARGEGAELIDVDGNRLIDYVCSWGPLIHGHAHPQVLAAVGAAAAAGTSFGAPTAGGGRARGSGREPLRERRDAAHDLIGHRGDDDGAPPRARGDRPRDGAEVRGRLSRPSRRAARAGRLGPRDAGAAEQPGRAGERGGGDDRRALERPRGAHRRRPRARRWRRSSPSRCRRTWGSCRRARGSSSCCASGPIRPARCSCSMR